MLRGTIGSSIKFRFLIIVIAAAVIFSGIFQVRKMPVDVLPEFSPPYVEIQTESLGLSAEEVEQLITVPMEQDLLNGVPWLDTIRSESVPGLSSIVLTFKPGTDLMRARQMVSERMTQAVALPHVSKPPTMLQPLSATGRVMIVGLSSKSLSLIQLGLLARWTIVPRLMGVPGVASVAVWGQRDRQLQVLIDPKRLKARGVALSDVLETTGNALWVSSLSFVEASTPGTGGFIDTPNQRLGVFHISPIITADGLAQVPIPDATNSNGTPLRLGDVANVVEDHQPLIGDALLNNDSSLLLVVEKFPGTNTLDLTHQLESTLVEMQPGLPGVSINTTLYRPATFIETALGNLGLALILGAVLLALLMGVFYWDWRPALISLVVILVSLAAACLVLALLGESLNVMVLAGLLMAVGVIIDDSIVGVENVLRRARQQHEAGMETPVTQIVMEIFGEMGGTAILAALVVLLLIVPVIFIQGTPGTFFQPLALAYGLGVLASVLVAILVTPAFCVALLGRAALDGRSSPPARWLTRMYQAAVTRVIQHGHVAYLVIAQLAIIGLVILPFLHPSLLPTFQERNLLISVNSVPGTSQPEMDRIASRISQELRSTPGVRSVGALIGRAVLGDQIVNVNSTEIWVAIDPAANYDQTVAAIQDVVSGYPGIQSKVQTYLKEVSAPITAQPKNSITVRVYGDVDSIMQSSAENVQKAIGGISGVTGTHLDLPLEQLTVETEVNLAAAQRYGISPGDVRRAAATMLAGLGVGNIFEEQKVFDVVVWSTPESRHSLTDIKDLLIDTPSGGTVRLGDVADVRIVPTASSIKHEAVKRYLDVIVDVQGRSLGAVAGDISSRLMQLQFPLEYHAEVLNDYTASQAEAGRLLIFGAAALIAMFFILQAAFGSWRLAALAFFTFPLALVGGLVAALIGGGTISIGSLVGFGAVFAVTARNTIFLIKRYQNLQRVEGEAFGPALAVRGACDRFIPILMTVSATALVFLPALVLGDIPGLEILRPMAVVLLGGLITSLLLNAFLLPALFLHLGESPSMSAEPTHSEQEANV
jgi:CzcA family heavy metal efflux pump